jgi:hypothetical protein
MQRRRFIRALSAATAGTFFSRSYAFVPYSSDKKKILQVGWITDVHHGYCEDADKRL